ncbi:hypothetical protein SAMN05216232_2242 [Virgibacillus subterraneus]|uniref:Uncharacterized protein n=2 Tax=Virgibacillus TaxID=84406 RepID=A0A1H1E5U1_9BACI|nr:MULTISPECIES: hypothetical protein [Virgibacillus]SDQ84077.1 hypothetical protein SAMN05216231_2738 [Virgibacillus salinus]SEQ38496.1 hypothetical protein SAMN05216232_2242 [Virgibacillus subterraneus]
MTETKIYCDRCTRPIEIRDDVITAKILLDVKAYHEECYAKDLKGMKSFFLDNTPINGTAGNITTVLTAILGIIWLFVTDGSMRFIALAALFPVGYRLYSYLAIERYLAK